MEASNASRDLSDDVRVLEDQLRTLSAQAVTDQAVIAVGTARGLADHAALAVANASLIAAERAAQARYRMMFDASPQSMFVIDAITLGVLDVNHAAVQHYGFERAELLTMTLAQLSPDEDVAHLRALVGRPALAAGEHVRHRYQDGTSCEVELRLHAMSLDDRACCLVLVTDLTALRRYERSHTDDVRRAQLAAIVESSGDAIISKTLTGVVTSWNAAAERMFGYTADDMIGQSIMRLIPASRDFEETDVLAQVEQGRRVASFDTVRVRKDGSELEVSLTISPVYDAAGQVIGASKVVRDITKRRRVEVALARAKDAAEASNRELEAFSYSVAHDLRAPLRAINGFAQLLFTRYRDKLDADGEDWLREIVTGARTMGALIDAMLALARLTRAEPHHERVDLSALVRASAARLAAGDPGRVVELVIEDDIVVELDPDLARALVDNLLANAWKFTSKVPHARIELGTNFEHGTRTLFIRDNGAGFDNAYAAKLFGPFQRLHAASEFPGTGIGLATVQRIVHRHGGRVSADGVVDGGATFYFSFPDRTPGASP